VRQNLFRSLSERPVFLLALMVHRFAYPSVHGTLPRSRNSFLVTVAKTRERPGFRAARIHPRKPRMPELSYLDSSCVSFRTKNGENLSQRSQCGEPSWENAHGKFRDSANVDGSSSATPRQPCEPTTLSGREQGSSPSDLMQQRAPSWRRNREPGPPFLTER